MNRELKKLWSALGIPEAYSIRRSLPLRREARRLNSIGPAADDGMILRMAPRAAHAWKGMCSAAADDSIHLLPLSAFRSVRRQAQIIRAKLADGQKLDDILRLVAAPGCSEHHTGRAIDIGSPETVGLDEAFAQTREYLWLKSHAGAFGFKLSYPRKNLHRIAYEPWHWCWHPKS